MRITKSNNWNVNIGRFLDGLVISVWIGNDDESWLLELSGLVVSEGTWGPFSLVRDAGSCEFGELDDSSLTSGLGRNGQNILGIWDGSNDSGSQEDFIVDLSDVEIDISGLTNESQVSSHLGSVVLTGDVAVGLDESKVVSFSLA